MDWPNFLDQYHIAYNTTGPNTSRGNIAVRCPLCASDEDEPQYRYMSISLDGNGYRCWRRPNQHYGKNPARLIQALIKCTWEQAQRIAGIAVHLPNDFAAQVRNTLEPPPTRSVPPLKLLPEFKPLSTLPSCRPFISYLEQRRGFTLPQITQFSATYGIQYCTRGPFKGRIIFPILAVNKLVTWTGRSIHQSVELRYKTLSSDYEKSKESGLPQAVAPINHYLLWQDELKRGGRSIYLCEGPFDALRVRVLGSRHDITATCFFTAQPSARQIDLLHNLLPKFERRYLLLDRGTMATSLHLGSLLQSLNIGIKQLPPHRKDPGELSEKELLTLDADRSSD
jgi:hypothetical protein